ncbi:SIR2-like domain protein [Collimonas arenae]|uniref:SIR2-like domain protein n=1 Tax=Collimonas arenae TaxID=279058 RepID=A0A127PP76_9BURK|nr:SIR2 family protein [Collimonas arenae]AMO99568.1 SIR2-like domain protein [Collimonas arenae]AMP09467.1 SIR2-like domain protein [Collimonas arenae]
MEVAIPTLSGAEFASAFALRPHLFAWFLGAGASAASGIPTGYAMIRDFKKRIFCQKNGYSIQEVDSGDPLWIGRIDEFFKRSNILPPDGDPEEYSTAFELVYPQENLRRQYIADAIRKGTPSFAHRVLAALMSSKQLNCLFTTNFDPLVEDSLTLSNALLPPEQQAKPTIAAIDSAERAKRCIDESDWPLVAKLHGDYTSLNIKNTSAELRTQDERMRGVLIEACKRSALVIVGYSGRDASIMEALESVLREPSAYPSGLYWVTSSRDRVLPAVQKLLENAAKAGVNVAVVESKNFDELAGDLISHIKLPDVLRNYVVVHKPTERLQPVVLRTADALPFPVLKYSALLVETLPTVARRVSISKALTTDEVRQLLKEQKCRAVFAALGNELAVFGRDDEILKALTSVDARVNGTIALNPEKDSWALGLLYDALTKALSRGRPLFPRLKRSGHALLVASSRAEDDENLKRRRETELKALKEAYGSPLTGEVPNLRYCFNEGIHLKLENVQDRWWCGFEPFTFVDVPRESRTKNGNESGDELGRPMMSAPDPSADWRRERWARKFNGNWSQIIAAWAGLLTSSEGHGLSSFWLSESEGINAVFKLSPVTGWSRPSHNHSYFDRNK